MQYFTIIMWMLFSFFVGGIPFSYLLPKIFRGIDIREHGSKNAGATNVLRVCGPVIGFFAFILDISKGAVVYYVASLFLGKELALLSSVFACVGHCYPPLLGFNGGKGVATAGGLIIARHLFSALVLLVIFIIIVFSTGFVSLGSITIAALLPIVFWLFTRDLTSTLIFAALAVFVIYRHKSNIKRLINHEESGIKEKFRLKSK